MPSLFASELLASPHLMAPDSESVLAYFDGACRGNQFARKGPMWVAYVLGDEENAHEIPDWPTGRGPQRSNNIAEYRALILLLGLLQARAARRPRERYVVCGDSQLVVYQMLGRYRVRDVKLLPLHEEARRLAKGRPVTFRWVPRGQNRAGHLLERRG